MTNKQMLQCICDDIGIAPNFVERNTRRVSQLLPYISHKSFVARLLAHLFAAYETLETVFYTNSSISLLSCQDKIAILKRITAYKCFYNKIATNINSRVGLYGKAASSQDLLIQLKKISPEENIIVSNYLKRLLEDKDVIAYISLKKTEAAQEQSRKQEVRSDAPYENVNIATEQDDIEYISIGHMKFRIK